MGLDEESAFDDLGNDGAETSERPRSALLGLGAKFVPHSKATGTAAAIDSKLKRRLDKSLHRTENEDMGPSSSNRTHSARLSSGPHLHNALYKGPRPTLPAKGGQRHAASAAAQRNSDSDSDGGKLAALSAKSKGRPVRQQVDVRQQRALFLQPPTASPLSKNERKKLRKKQKKAEQQDQQHQD